MGRPRMLSRFRYKNRDEACTDAALLGYEITVTRSDATTIATAKGDRTVTFVLFSDLTGCFWRRYYGRGGD